VTAGGLVFTGRLTGEFMAVDAETGKIHIPSILVVTP
jgi:hypothetical protein